MKFYGASNDQVRACLTMLINRRSTFRLPPYGILTCMAWSIAVCDQVPPTLFWPYDGPVEYSADGTRVTVAAWNYQCPQCKHQGAQRDASGHYHFDPWCDDVVCGVGPPAPPAMIDSPMNEHHSEQEPEGWYGFGT